MLTTTSTVRKSAIEKRTKKERAVKNVQEIPKRMVISFTRKTWVEVVIRTRPKIAADMVRIKIEIEKEKEKRRRKRTRKKTKKKRKNMQMIKTKKRIRELTRIEKTIRTENTIKTRKNR